MPDIKTENDVAPDRPIATSPHLKLWGGRFAGSTAATLEELNNSLPVDKRLWREDIDGSRAWVQALLRADVLTRAEAQQLDRGLLAVGEKLATMVVRMLTIASFCSVVAPGASPRRDHPSQNVAKRPA